MFQGMEYVYLVYKQQSFSRAAKLLFISQPSLSATIKRIENKVGYPIFDRSTKPLSLTVCGQHYIQAVEQMMRIQNDFAAYINDLGKLKSGNLVIGGTSLYSSLVLPKMLTKFSQEYPGVEIDLVEESTSRLVEMLQHGSVDLIFDNCHLDSMVYDREEYKRERLFLAVPSALEVNDSVKEYQIPVENILNQSYDDDFFHSVPLEVFKDEPFIMLKMENDTRKRAMEICQSSGFMPKILFELDQQMTSYHITCSGMGISFISDLLISGVPVNSNVSYYKIDRKQSERKVYFYWKRGRYFSRAMEEFLHVVKNEKDLSNSDIR